MGWRLFLALAPVVWLWRVISWRVALAGWWALRRERAVTLLLLAGSAAAGIVFAAGALTIALRT